MNKEVRDFVESQLLEAPKLTWTDTILQHLYKVAGSVGKTVLLSEKDIPSPYKSSDYDTKYDFGDRDDGPSISFMIEMALKDLGNMVKFKQKSASSQRQGYLASITKSGEARLKKLKLSK